MAFRRLPPGSPPDGLPLGVGHPRHSPLPRRLPPRRTRPRATAPRFFSPPLAKFFFFPPRTGLPVWSLARPAKNEERFFSGTMYRCFKYLSTLCADTPGVLFITIFRMSLHFFLVHKFRTNWQLLGRIVLSCGNTLPTGDGRRTREQGGEGGSSRRRSRLSISRSLALSLGALKRRREEKQQKQVSNGGRE